ncbi:MAG: hypothetical protein LBJ67_04420 [Planctomycetaceae bacterium]|jgi:hypothetical protein|nr:hypothetical protein [Planctomycetaceae bacterium]
MECLSNIYDWNKKDITFFTCYKIKQILDLLVQRENRDFEEVYTDFLESNTYQAIQDTGSLMWYENAEFIIDEYYREKS